MTNPLAAVEVWISADGLEDDVPAGLEEYGVPREIQDEQRPSSHLHILHHRWLSNVNWFSIIRRTFTWLCIFVGLIFLEVFIAVLFMMFFVITR